MQASPQSLASCLRIDPDSLLLMGRAAVTVLTARLPSHLSWYLILVISRHIKFFKELFSLRISLLHHYFFVFIYYNLSFFSLVISLRYLKNDRKTRLLWDSQQHLNTNQRHNFILLKCIWDRLGESNQNKCKREININNINKTLVWFWVPTSKTIAWFALILFLLLYAKNLDTETQFKASHSSVLDLWYCTFNNLYILYKEVLFIYLFWFTVCLFVFLWGFLF